MSEATTKKNIERHDPRQHGDAAYLLRRDDPEVDVGADAGIHRTTMSITSEVERFKFRISSRSVRPKAQFD